MLDRSCYNLCMENKKKPDGDVNETAFNIMQQATGEDIEPEAEPRQKNAAAVALGRLGGLKGGKARADLCVFAARRLFILYLCGEAFSKTTQRNCEDPK